MSGIFGQDYRIFPAINGERRKLASVMGGSCQWRVNAADNRAPTGSLSTAMLDFDFYPQIMRMIHACASSLVGRMPHRGDPPCRGIAGRTFRMNAFA
ncbi:hypothetical protein [Chromobacterium sinusclupearum]|uniref:hypothetical protein n=1 Tax=Chromobacterium sinusclupearum TaxID=2077146 RepID=UPI0011AF8C24|nr:hypothetical protein [Chromobacterium sinusclupearum]